MTDKSKTEELTDADLDNVQGAGSRVKQTGDKGVVLSSETFEPNIKGKRDDKGYLIITMEN